ncbi:MAG: VCBS repeat-containing protein [Planctomycetota bacterium]
MTRRLIPFVLAAFAAGCSNQGRLKNYEVGELEEERVQKAVKAIAAGLEAGDVEKCVSSLVPDFHQFFDEGRMVTISSPDGMTLSKWEAGGFPTMSEMDRAGMKKWFEAYLGTWVVVERALAKIRRVDFDEDDLSVARGRFFLDVYGISSGGEAREDLVYLELRFKKAGDAWQISRIELDEPFMSSHCGKAQFRNVSREVNGVWPHERNQNARGYLPIPEQTADCGLACGDYDGDGFYDVYLLNGRSKRLLRNKGDGTFEDVAEKAGVAEAATESRSALLVDLDNDGDDDLYIGNNQTPNKLFRNNGDGTFTDVTADSGVGYVGFSTSCTAADYDRDGDIDIYQCCYGNFYERLPLPPAFDGQPNRLYRNKGGLKFEEVGEDAGVNDTGWTLAATWGDANNDNWPDLLTANDFGVKSLYINQKDGTFEEDAEDAGCLDRGFGMSTAFGDIDNDGDFDIYFSNMYSNTNWIFQRTEILPMPWFLHWLRTQILGTLDSMTLGNTLCLNNGDGTFSNITANSGVDYGQWAWGSEFIDYDADGDLDIYCANGFISGTDAEDL